MPSRQLGRFFQVFGSEVLGVFFDGPMEIYSKKNIRRRRKVRSTKQAKRHVRMPGGMQSRIFSATSSVATSLFYKSSSIKNGDRRLEHLVFSDGIQVSKTRLVVVFFWLLFCGYIDYSNRFFLKFRWLEIQPLNQAVLNRKPVTGNLMEVSFYSKPNGSGLWSDIALGI